MATIEQKRGAILAKRIKTINNFLVDKMGTNITFGDYLKSLGINEDKFFSELPKSFVIKGISKATSSSRNLIDYGSALNLHLFNQKLIHDGVLSADGLIDGIVPANYIAYSADADEIGVVTPATESYDPSKGEDPCIRPAMKRAIEAYKAILERNKPTPPNSPIGTSVIYDIWNNNKRFVTNLESRLPSLGKTASLANSFLQGAPNELNTLYNTAKNRCSTMWKPTVATEDTGLFGLKGLGKTVTESVKDFGGSIKNSIQGAGVGLKDQLPAINKINPAFVVMRAAFLSLLALNIAGLASALKAIKNSKNKTDWNKIKKKWDIFGGEEDKLSTNIDRGSNKKPFPPIRGKRHSADGDELTQAELSDPKNAGTIAASSAGALAGLAAVLGSNPATAGAAVYVASAGGILAAFSPILKNFAKENGEDVSSIPDLPKDPNVDEDTQSSLDEDGILGFVNNYKWWIIGILGLGTIVTIVVMASGKKNN